MADMNINWNPYSSGGAGLITQFGQASASSASTQNGAAAAQLVSVSIANGGGVVASYSNGIQTVVGQVATAVIGNPNTLIDVGNNDFGLSASTDNPRAAAEPWWAALWRPQMWTLPRNLPV
jgi:flagellar hook protein FlgE